MPKYNNVKLTAEARQIIYKWRDETGLTLSETIEAVEKERRLKPLSQKQIDEARLNSSIIQDDALRTARRAGELHKTLTPQKQ